jgi:hypothetical protein
MAAEEWFLALKENKFNPIIFHLEMFNKFTGRFQ